MIDLFVFKELKFYKIKNKKLKDLEEKLKV